MKWSSTSVSGNPTEDPSSGRWFAIKRTFYWSRPLQIASMMLADAVILVMAAALAYFTRFEGSVPEFFLEHLPVALVLGMTVFIAALWGFGLYHLVLRYVGITMMTRLTAAATTAIALLGLTDFAVGRITGARPVPLGVVLIFGVFAFVGLAALRSLGRLWVVMSAALNGGEHRVLIVGAGDAGSLLLRDIETQPHLGYDVVGLLDDRPVKHNLMVRGVRVLGPIDQVAEVVAEYHVDEIMVAIPSAAVDRRREVLELCSATGVPTRVVPGFALQTHQAGVADLRPVAIEDLLGRAPNEIDLDLIAGTLRDKVVAVTGAAGSIGSELCRQIMRMHPRRLLLLEIDESRLYELALEMESLLPGVAIMHVCDVRDSRKLMRIFRKERPQAVFHAAAYKHVPIMESEPDEAVRTNVLGTINVLKACAEVGAERFVLISTDKAVDPRNIMGATKALAERVMIAAASSGVGAVAVRFGNVLGSRGSVIPIFEEQLRGGGPITVTHPDVTRFFMTIPEAVRLVLQSQAMSDGADVFVLDMGEPIRIVDLAQRMISLSGVHTHIEYTGLRPGEKLHEILVHGDADLVPTSCPVVQRLNALPCITPEFSRQMGDLLLNARLGRGAEIRELLALMTGAQFETSDPEEGDS